MRPGISHYCQKCLAANPLGQEFCTRCGTRLMIVVEPSASRFESTPASLSTDEHLLERMWTERCQRDTVEQEENVQRDALRLRILASASVSDKEAFEELVIEGFVLLEDKQIPQGITKLQAAAEISVENAPLNLFIGEHYFRKGKTKLARPYLAKAHWAQPAAHRISLLLGLTY